MAWPNRTFFVMRFDLRRLAALVRKEGAQILRDPSTFLIAFVLPMILLFLFGYAVSLDSTRTRVGLVIQDSSAPALRLAQAYRSSRYFEVTEARSVAEVRDKLVDGELRALIVIPQDFGRGVKRGRVPPIQIVTDGSQPNTANFAAAYGEGVRATWAAAEGLERDPGARAAPVAVSARYWYNPELKSRFFLVPGSIANVMTMVGTLLTALVVAREWERGTMEAMMATPISMAEFIASKVIPYFILAQASMALCAGDRRVDIRGAVPGLDPCPVRHLFGLSDAGARPRPCSSRRRPRTSSWRARWPCSRPFCPLSCSPASSSRSARCRGRSRR